MYQVKTLEKFPLEKLYQTFMKAFSDYAVPFNQDFSQYENMLKRRSYQPEISVGAFQEDQLVGFVLSGLRKIEGQWTAYDLMTGIEPESRGKGLSNQMMTAIMEAYVEAGVEEYQLEVLQENTTAYHLYEKQGMTIRRSFSVMQAQKELVPPDKSISQLYFVEKLSPEEWDLVETFADAPDSWQNARQSVENVAELFDVVLAKIDNRIVGHGIVERATGDVPQLAVAKNARRQGIGQDLLAAIQTHSQKPLRLVNIDTSLVEMLQFLTNLGFTETTNQYEMVMTITTE